MTRDHTLRAALSNELHARPPSPIHTPARASHVAMLSGETAASSDRAHFGTLCRRFGMAEPAPEANHHLVDLGFARVKWERHTEYSAYTVYRDGCDAANPFAQPAIDALPADWVSELAGERIVAVHIALVQETPNEANLVHLFGNDGFVGAHFSGERAMGWTDFRIHGDGWSRILVQDHNLGVRSAGRLVQRLVEIENYRILALLSLPIAWEAMARLSVIERAVTETLVDNMPRSGLKDDRALLDVLTSQASACESIAAETSYRFAATRAYHGLVTQRLLDLRELRIEGLPGWGEFMARRYAPAIATCEAVAARLDALSLRTHRAANLLRTRVDVALEGQNADLLASMDRRADLQLRLQETVEGLSVVAISYYALALVGHAVQGLRLVQIDIDPDMAEGVAVLPVVILVWLGLHCIKRRIARSLNKPH
ncbi:MAG: DUF3422 domain-containing protein [Acetobacteraceae bacterium]|nr:DUF3422 domain-containing protein [Acetobacteraceae bacterium]